VLEVLWSPTPGAPLTRLSHTVLSNTIGCPCNQGLYFVRIEFARTFPDCERSVRAFVSSMCSCLTCQPTRQEAYTPGGSFNWKSLRSTEETVFTDYWNSWTPVVQHKEVVGRIWYPNDNSFVKEIPVFSKLDRYVLRWRGTIKIPVKGGYIFEYARRFHPLQSILTEIYLCHTCSYHEILRMETPGQDELRRREY
jgi:hypothetical protein